MVVFELVQVRTGASISKVIHRGNIPPETPETIEEEMQVLWAAMLLPLLS